jgi:hypothetical protein
MDHNPSGNEEIDCRLWNPDVRSPVFKSSPLVPILDLMKKLHDFSRHLFDIHFNIILTKSRILEMLFS